MNKYTLFLLLVVIMATGCASTETEKEIVYVPKEVKVSVYRNIILEEPPEPVYEVCSLPPSILERVQCVGRNITKLEHYSKELRSVIEANNAAAKEPIE